MRHTVELEMEWHRIGRGGSPTTSTVRVEYIPYPPTEQYRLMTLHAAVLSVKGWDILAIPPSSLGGATRSNYSRFRKLFREVTGYRGKGLLDAVKADYEAQLNGRYRR